MKKPWSRLLQIIKYMMLNKIKERVIKFISNEFNLNLNDFFIDNIVELNGQNIIFFYYLPSDFDLMNKIGLSYNILPSPILYSKVHDNFEVINIIDYIDVFENKPEINKSASRCFPVYNYNDIIKYLNYRGFLTFEDFERLFKNFNLSIDNLIFSYNGKEMDEIIIEGFKQEQYNIMVKFINKINAVSLLNDDKLVIQVDLKKSDYYYDKLQKKIFPRLL